MTMPAYVVVNVDVRDPVRYEDYKRLAGPTIALYGGRYLSRGGPSVALEGSVVPRRMVILQFDSAERAKQWWSSSEYREARGIRQSCAGTDMILVEGT
jgi:uncharacterized protein (DUF1330 family)